MTSTQFGSVPRALLGHTSLRAVFASVALTAVLLFSPVHASGLESWQPSSPAGVQDFEVLQEQATPPSWSDPALPQRGPLLAARGSISDSGRPARQLRVGGAGGGFHGPSHDGLPFEPEVPGQSIQQSIGQTLGQPQKPAPSKTLENPQEKAIRKKPQKSSTSAKGKLPSKPAKKPQAPAQKKPMATVYLITMNDGQVFKGTMKPAGASYIVSTKNGPLTIKKKNIVRLTKVTQ